MPRLRRHENGQATVRLNGVDHYFGRWGSEGVEDAYDELIGRWLAHGRVPVDLIRDRVSSLDEVADRFLEWAEVYYRKCDRPTKTLLSARRSIELLYQAGLMKGRLEDFGPMRLKAFQGWLAADPGRRWSRSTINEYVRHVVRMFTWAAGEELIDSDLATRLQHVDAIRKHRPAPVTGVRAREVSPVLPVPEADIEAAIKHLPTVIAAMVRVQLLTAMRPGALIHLRPLHLAATSDERVRAYRPPPEAYKLEHLEELGDQHRVVYIGPRAWSILEPLVPEDPEEYFFSPRRSELERNGERREARASTRWKSHHAEARRARRNQKPASWGAHYSVDSYRRAVERACATAFGDTEGGRLRWWTPARLRHNAATYIASREALDVARIVLGHTSVETTLIYAMPAAEKAIKAAKRLG